MINRREFIKTASLASTALAWGKTLSASETDFPVVRIPENKRRFQSESVERTIRQVRETAKNRELAWMFGNCFPNTLDTTVDYSEAGGRPDTYVITGDIDAMWLRDSSAQVWPYLRLVGGDVPLRRLIAGVINRQTRCILRDPYANAFYKDENRVSEWKDDLTDMKPGIHERKWEVDSLCYPIRLAHGYWKATHDRSPFDEAWRQAIVLSLRTFREQQRLHDRGPYHFQRKAASPTDTLAEHGYGAPARPNGLIRSMFRPSDDATVFPYFIPSNFFAVVSLRLAAELLEATQGDHETAAECRALAGDVAAALARHARVDDPRFGPRLAYEVDGYGNAYSIDDGNIPSLLSLPYLGCLTSDDPLYQATRRFVLSEANPYYCAGRAGEGPGGPHVGRGMIWPLGIIMRAFTSSSATEIRQSLNLILRTHAGTGFIHEAFNQDDPTQFTRPWFAWANTLFGELVLFVRDTHPSLLSH